MSRTKTPGPASAAPARDRTGGVEHPAEGSAPPTTRQVPEWIADHPDQAIPPRVKLRVWQRCGGVCAITGRKLRPGDAYEFDHIIALVNGGQHRERNLQVVSAEGHKAKTADDVKVKSKIARVAAKHAGTWPKSKQPIRSRGFAPTRAQRGQADG